MRGDTDLRFCTYTCTELPSVPLCCHFATYYNFPKKKSVPELNDQPTYIGQQVYWHAVKQPHSWRMLGSLLNSHTLRRASFILTIRRASKCCSWTQKETNIGLVQSSDCWVCVLYVQLVLFWVMYQVSEIQCWIVCGHILFLWLPKGEKYNRHRPPDQKKNSLD